MSDKKPDPEVAEAAEAFHQLGEKAASSLLDLMHCASPGSAFPATNAASGMILACVIYLTHTVGSDAVVAVLDHVSQQALMHNKPSPDGPVHVHHTARKPYK